MLDVSDSELVARTLRHDGQAFGTLVTRYEGLVSGIVSARVRDPEIAKDIVQDAFLTAWRELEKLRDAERIGSWVGGIARNLAASELRRRSRQTRLLALAAAEPSAANEDAPPSFDDELATLSSTHREVLVLFYVEGKSIAAIARQLSIAEPAVKQRLSRGRKELRARTLVGIAGAGIVATRSAAAAGGFAKGMVLLSIKHVVLAALAVLILIAATAGLIHGNTDDESSPTVAATPTTVKAPTSPATAGPTAAIPRGTRRLDATQYASLLEAIRTIHRARSSTATTTPAPALPEAVTIDKQYVRSAVREIVPLIQECYEEGMLRDPTIEGTVAVDFTIEGEPGVGAVVGESVVDNERSTITDPEVRECIQETMHALSLDPPSTGGTVQVRYPFTFRRIPPP